MPDVFEKRYGWVLDVGRVNYDRVLRWQRGLVKMRREGLARDTIIIVEHPAVITVGRSGHQENFAGLEQEAVHIERGGDVTYHGPGQLVVYFIFNLSARGRDLHQFMSNIQEGIIAALADIGIEAKRGEEHTGVWCDDKKIASIGVAVKKWITFHGAAINLNTKLKEFQKIQPCGLNAGVMTSAHKVLNKKVDMQQFAHQLLRHYSRLFQTEFDPVQLEAIAEEVESQAGGYTI